jgi:MFS family permease
MKDNAYRHYLLAVLSITLGFNSVDRMALGLLLQDIKLDLSLSDTQLGLLTGIAFALFYSVMGIPISRWADRGNRITIISTATALWSVAVALCGVAGNFLQLLMIRVGVAVGEAGCLPSSLSLISDYFSRAERPRAVAIYLQGGVLSIVIGYFVGGWLNQFYGWRMTFMLLGLPGLVLAPLVRFTLREPRQVKGKDVQTGTAVDRALGEASGNAALLSPVSFGQVCVVLWRNVTFRHLLFFYSLSAFFNVGVAQWQPAFFVRRYGLGTGELGTWIAAIGGFGMMLGTYLGGRWASRQAANDERFQLKVMSIVYSSVGLISTLIYVAPNQYCAFALMGLWNIAGTMTSGPLIAAIQTMVPERMRATAIAIVFLFANLVGMGLGPLAVGALSDVLQSRAGQDSLRYALLALCPGYIWAAWHLWRASTTVTHDVEVAERRQHTGDHSVIEDRSSVTLSALL